MYTAIALAASNAAYCACSHSDLVGGRHGASMTQLLSSSTIKLEERDNDILFVMSSEMVSLTL